jgi:hypothetical protein
MLTPAASSSRATPLLQLSPAVSLNPGKYWVSVSVTIQDACCVNNQDRMWYWRQLDTTAATSGAPFAEFDGSKGTIFTPTHPNVWVNNEVGSPGAFRNRADQSFMLYGTVQVTTTGSPAVPTTAAIATSSSAAAAADDGSAVIIIVVVVVVVVLLVGGVVALFLFRRRQRDLEPSVTPVPDPTKDPRYTQMPDFDDNDSPSPNSSTPLSPPDVDKGLIDYEELDIDADDELGRGAFGVVFKVSPSNVVRSGGLRAKTDLRSFREHGAAAS